MFFHCNRKQCITSESQFDFLKELVENIPDLPTNEEEADDLDEPKPKRYAGVKFEGGGCVCGWGGGCGWWNPKNTKNPNWQGNQRSCTYITEKFYQKCGGVLISHPRIW